MSVHGPWSREWKISKTTPEEDGAPMLQEKEANLKLTNSVGFILPNSRELHHWWLHSAHSLKSVYSQRQQAHEVIGLFHVNLFSRRWPSPQKCILSTGTTRNFLWPTHTETDGVKLNKFHFVFLPIWWSSVKENDTPLNALLQDGWPFLKSTTNTLKCSPWLNLLCFCLLTQNIKKYFQNSQVLPSLVNKESIKSEENGLVTKNVCSFMQHLLVKGLKALPQRR